ncbi:MAG: hypothetical protein ACI379_14130 [Nocardioides sp.]|uniref:hypothetical protein n=1 Tax=Nocardioides sp. TaxID=35761 RepID=UPI003F10525C
MNTSPALSVASGVLGVALRTVVLTVASYGLIWLIDAVAPTADANIGAGLMAFAAVMGVTFFWAIWDACRNRWWVSAIVWACTAALFAVVSNVVTNWTDGERALTDLVTFRPDLDFFMAALVIAPAVVGIPLGIWRRPFARAPRLTT